MSWIEDELTAYEKLDKDANVLFLKFENNKILNLKIDFTAPFEKKVDKFQELKVWIPVKENINNILTDKMWTLNTANPFYRELLKLGKSGKTDFKIIKTGQGQDTRFTNID